MLPTFIEEIVARHAVDWDRPHPPRPGDLVWLLPDRVMTHDNSSAVLSRFRAMGASRVAHPERCVIALDHDIQNRSRGNLDKYAAIEAFARAQGIEFHPAGSGIGHQIMIERGHAPAGALVVAADSHANMYGACGALGTPVARSDAAGIWATGAFWWEVPPIVRVVLEGRLPAGATGKDAALVLCALYPSDVLGCAVEFHGSGARALSADDRLTIANLTTEWGAIAGVFPPDPPARGGAAYAATITLDLAEVAAHVTGPDTLSRSVPASELAAAHVTIQKAYLVSCANARASDLEAAAAVLRGRRVADGVRLYVAAASASVEREARAGGAWGALLDAGAIPLPSGCGPCIGLGEGVLEPGETGISASNRNFKGRMGSPDARCYLASPAVVAASAVAGHIRAPDGGGGAGRPARRIDVPAADRTEAGAPRGPAAPTVSGRLVAFPRDAIDTDVLCPARLVYADGTSRDELARAAFASADPTLSARIRPGDVLVAGERFGIGSSREQAAHALIALGLRAVVAESLAPVFRRNAWNNGLLALEAPAFVRALRARWPRSAEAAEIPGDDVVLDFEGGVIAVGGLRAPLPALPSVARDLLAAGGLDRFVRARAPSAAWRRERS